MANFLQGIPAPGQFPIKDHARRGVNWTEYREGFERYSSAIGINDPAQQANLFLIVAGPDVTRLSKTLNTTPRTAVNAVAAVAAANGQPAQPAIAAVAAENQYTALMRALNDYFLPLSNKEMCIITFHAADQRKDESIDEYYSRLQALAPGCRFQDVDSAIKSQLIKGLRAKSLKRMALSKHQLTLAQFLDKARAHETTEIHLTRLEGGEECESINKMGGEKWHRRSKHQQERSPEQQQQPLYTRHYKGVRYPHQHQTYQYQNSPDQFQQPEPEGRYQQSEGHYSQHQRQYHQSDQYDDDQYQEGGRNRKPANGQCMNCGGLWHKEGRDSCPAQGHKCVKCYRYNHYEHMCLTSKFRNQQQQSGFKERRNQADDDENKRRRSIRFARDKEEESDSDDDDRYPIGPLAGR